LKVERFLRFMGRTTRNRIQSRRFWILLPGTPLSIDSGKFIVRYYVIILLLLSLPTAVVRAAPELSEFVIYLWGTPDGNDLKSKAHALAEAGFTVVDWAPQNLDFLQGHGLKAMVHGATPELARGLAENPSVWGFHLRDEPYPESEFLRLAEQVEALKEASPAKFGFVNMLSTTGEFLRTYMRIVKPEILSFDYYQWWWGSDRYFEKLEQFRDQAVLARVPLGSCIEVSANPGVERGDNTYLTSNATKLRQSLYTNLAYGVKAVEWFSSRNLFEPGTTSLTQAGKDVAALNQELKRIGSELVKLKSLDVFHTPPLSRGTHESPKEHWVQLIGEPTRDGLVLGMFEDADGTDYAMIVNRDYRDGQSVTVRLQSKWLGISPWHEPKRYHYGIERFNKTAGDWEVVSSSSFVGFTFVIGSADGELFRITTTADR